MKGKNFITEEFVKSVGETEFSLEESFMVFLTRFVYRTLKKEGVAPMSSFEFFELCRIVHGKLYPEFEKSKRISEKKLKDYILPIYNTLFKPTFKVY